MEEVEEQQSVGPVTHKMAAVNSVVAVVAVSLLVSVCQAASGNFEYPEKEGRTFITWGTIGPGDELLYTDEPTLSSSLFRIQSYDICYPNLGRPDRVRISHYNVVAVDGQGLAHLNKEMKSDEHRLCLHLKTRRGEGYHFKIDVWGRKI